MNRETDVAIIGAGIVGLATAYYLAREAPSCRITMVDAGEPMAFTSAQSGNNYRNWWPHPLMVGFMDRSISLMERIAQDTGNRIDLTRRGYVLASRGADISMQYRQLVASLDGRAAQSIRIHDRADGTGYLPPIRPDWDGAPDGFDFLTDPALIRRSFPSLAGDIRSILHVRRAGDVSGQQLGQVMFEEIRARGVNLVRGKVRAIDQGRRFTLALEGADGRSTLVAERLVNAAGPFAAEVAAMLGVSLPLANVLQQKVAFPDTARTIPRDLPFTIDMDSQLIDWTEEERAILRADPDTERFAGMMPGAIHCRPDGGDAGNWVKLGWAYNVEPTPVDWGPALDPRFPEIVLRGAARLHPALKAYYGKLPRQMHHYGGWYTKTPDNWPLIGPMGPEGVFMVCGLSGHGTMGACASGELAAAWMTGGSLPDWGQSFTLSRFNGQEPGRVAEEGLL